MEPVGGVLHRVFDMDSAIDMDSWLLSEVSWTNLDDLLYMRILVNPNTALEQRGRLRLLKLTVQRAKKLPRFGSEIQRFPLWNVSLVVQSVQRRRSSCNHPYICNYCNARTVIYGYTVYLCEM